MLIKEENYWDAISQQYINSVKEDKTGIFAYEKNVNTPSILSLCPDSAVNVLDLGCGDARFTNDLAHIYPYVVGIDYSDKMLNYAKKKYPHITFLKQNLETPFPTFSGKFDLITAKLTLMYIKDLDFLISQCEKVLSDKGSFVISVTHPVKWLTERESGDFVSNQYKGYLSEIILEGNIAHNSKIPLQFINRTIETYVNTFAKHKFVLQTLLETGAPDAFVIEYSRFLKDQKNPFRLNMKFIKK